MQILSAFFYMTWSLIIRLEIKYDYVRSDRFEPFEHAKSECRGKLFKRVGWIFCMGSLSLIKNLNALIVERGVSLIKHALRASTSDVLSTHLEYVVILKTCNDYPAHAQIPHLLLFLLLIQLSNVIVRTSHSRWWCYQPVQ